MLALIDLDGTLIDREEGFGQWARALVESADLGVGALPWLLETDLAVKERGAFFARLGSRFPAVGDTEALWDDYRARMPALAPAFPGVIEELARLRVRRWTLAIVTNGRVDNQLGKLRRTGIDQLVDGWCISEEVGLRKPDPAMFAFARHRFSATEDEPCWMVGDDPHVDVLGGLASGMNTIWVSHGQSWPLADVSPHLVAETPAQALAMLGDL